MKSLLILTACSLMGVFSSNNITKNEGKTIPSSKYQSKNIFTKTLGGGFLNVYNYSNATIGTISVAGVQYNNLNIGPNSMANLGEIEISLQGYYIYIQTTNLNNIGTVNLVLDPGPLDGWIPPPGPSGQIVATGMPEDIPDNTFWDLFYDNYMLGYYSLVILPSQ